MKNYTTIQAYMRDVPKGFLPKIQEMYALVTQCTPGGEEAIKYGMPTIIYKGRNLIHFAAMKGHIGLYPSPSGVSTFEKELKEKGLSFSKGCIRFPYGKPLPIPLIKKIIAFRLQEEKRANVTK